MNYIESNIFDMFIFLILPDQRDKKENMEELIQRTTKSFLPKIIC